MDCQTDPHILTIFDIKNYEIFFDFPKLKVLSMMN